LLKGADRPFNHHDTNTLKLVAAPTLNPWAAILKNRSKQGR
jgi:aryl carrier-like protein